MIMAAVSLGRLEQPPTRQSPSTISKVADGERFFRWNAKTLVLAVVAIADLLPLASFYAGLKQAPPPSQPTFRQLTFRRGAITGARFSPDGGTLIYSAAFDGKPVELFTSHLESPESSSLKIQAGIESISSTGEMAVLLNCELDAFGCHNGTLARVAAGWRHSPRDHGACLPG